MLHKTRAQRREEMKEEIIAQIFGHEAEIKRLEKELDILDLEQELEENADYYREKLADLKRGEDS